MTFILAIDQGTSGTKAIVVDEAGAARSLAEVAVVARATSRAAGSSRTRRRSSSRSSTAGPPRGRRGGGARSPRWRWPTRARRCWPGTAPPADRSSPAVVWQDRRAEAVCAARRDAATRVGRAAPGWSSTPTSPRPRCAGCGDHVTTEGVVTTTDTWLVHRLCGAFVTDVSTASRSLLLDLDDATWTDELLEHLRAGRRARCPTIVANDDVVGTTRAFGGDVPVAGLIVDQQAALLAERCLDAGTAKCTFGTGAFLLAQLGDRRGPVLGRPDHVGGLAAPRATRRTASTGRSTRRRRPSAGPASSG